MCVNEKNCLFKGTEIHDENLSCYYCRKCKFFLIAQCQEGLIPQTFFRLKTREEVIKVLGFLFSTFPTECFFYNEKQVGGYSEFKKWCVGKEDLTDDEWVDRLLDHLEEIELFLCSYKNTN